MNQTFTIEGRLASLNDYVSACRTSPHVGAQLKRHETERCMWAIAAAKLRPIPAGEQVDVHILWVEPNTRRDHDNVSSGKKYILDALVSMGILAGDGWKFVDAFCDSFQVNKQAPRIVVTLIPKGRKQ